MEDYGGYYARDGGWSGGGRRDDYVRDFSGLGPRNWPSDARLFEEVCERLTDDDVVDASEVEVQVNGAEVTLTGTVASRREKRRAENVAWSVPGVRDVMNALRVGERDREVALGKASE
jgi:BON domain